MSLVQAGGTHITNAVTSEFLPASYSHLQDMYITFGDK